ncbi:unnamed protein product [Didymodactylos carnosus]|uniref:Uncharacterized protein n=1 Tax=Didymodactylos carnosus TaxID=1234261 RepID=A0A814NTT8_9BILA|nr:unnamed protein product [Didymodactylos carnosus]CAF3861094.1 unnamed protein product [Didymodactylos carnosus]
MSSRRSNVPQLPRVPNPAVILNETTNGHNRPPSAGDILRRNTLASRKLNRSNSEKTNGHPQPPLTTNGATSNLPPSSQTSSVSWSSDPKNVNNHNNTNNSLEEMSLSFMKVSSVKPPTDNTASGNQHQNTTKKKPGTIIDYRAIINDTLRGNTDDNGDPAERLLKPLSGFVGYNSEWRELAEVVSRSVIGGINS